ncbi:MAG: hypothetical protein D4R84_17110 [Rhodocyclaceae bacterium]|nr:MAG: hypothetical protein D4R84_17110 [Rhodocyclaceae bacterium]
MRINSIKTVLALSVMAMFATVAVADDKADPKKPAKPAVEAKAEAGKAKEDVKGDAPKNSTAPVAKRSGPYTCDIHVDNRTDWFINRVYVDRQYVGSVGQGGDSYIRDVGKGATRVYAELDFTDGSTRHYGPVVFNCEAYTTHHWKLN